MTKCELVLGSKRGTLSHINEMKNEYHRVILTDRENVAWIKHPFVIRTQQTRKVSLNEFIAYIALNRQLLFKDLPLRSAMRKGCLSLPLLLEMEVGIPRQDNWTRNKMRK